MMSGCNEKAFLTEDPKIIYVADNASRKYLSWN